MDPDESESLGKWTTVLFLAAAVLPFVGFIIGSTLNPSGWLSGQVLFPYAFPLILIAVLIESILPGLEFTYLTLFLGVVAIGVVVHAIRRKYKASPPKFKFGFAVTTFIVSFLYMLFVVDLVETAAETYNHDEFTA